MTGTGTKMGTKSSNKFLILLLMVVGVCVLALSLLLDPCSAFQSDELVLDDDEFEGVGSPPSSSPTSVLNHNHNQNQNQNHRPPPSPSPSPPQPQSSSSSSSSHGARKRLSSDSSSDSDSKLQFILQHAFANSDFSSAGTFSARLKTWPHGGQTLTKLRFSRNQFTETEKKNFTKLLDADDFYRIRVPSNVLTPPGREYIVSSIKARCLPRDGLDEHFVLHMEGVNILAVNYGSSGACQYPRLLKYPKKWSFNSHTVLKNSDQAPRTPIFTEDTFVGENGEGEGVKPIERSFWAKYWMYLIPLGLIVMNAMTQAMNMPEEHATGQSQQAVQRGQAAAVRRR